MNESNQLNALGVLISWNKEELLTHSEAGQAKRQEVPGGKWNFDPDRRLTQVIHFIASQ